MKKIYKKWKKWLLDIENNNYTINFEGPTDFVVWGKRKSKAKNTKIGVSLSIYYSNKMVERKINSIREKLKQDLANSKDQETRKRQMTNKQKPRNHQEMKQRQRRPGN